MKKSNKMMKDILKVQAKARRKLHGSDSIACNDMNLSNSDNNIHSNDSSSAKPQDGRTTSKSDKHKNNCVPNTITLKGTKEKKPSPKKRKRVYTYSVDDFPSGEGKEDNNVAESRRVHKKICRVQRDVVASSFDLRTLDKKQRKEFSAICGMRKRYCKDMLASDIRLREQLGYAVIDEMEELHRLSDLDDTLLVYLVTPLSDKFQFSIRDGSADIKGCIDKFMALLRQYTSLSAFGIAETQAILDQTGERAGETLYTHIHSVAWTRDADDAKLLVARAKGYNAKLTKIPILAEILKTSLGDYTRVGRYLCKPPYEGKKVNQIAFKAGKKCLRGPLVGIEKYHRLRLLELLAKQPLECTVFGVREGTAFKGRVLNRVRKWHRGREGTKVSINSANVEQLFIDVLSKNKRLKNYPPLRVRYSRSQNSRFK